MSKSINESVDDEDDFDDDDDFGEGNCEFCSVTLEVTPSGIEYCPVCDAELADQLDDDDVEGSPGAYYRRSEVNDLVDKKKARTDPA